MDVEYHFKFENDTGFSFKVEKQKAKEVNSLENPAWTNLEYCQCENCPLMKEENPKCPVSVGLYQLVEKVSNSLSFEYAKVTVQTKHRAYYKETDLQSGLFSLMGYIMASSECPHFKFLRPLAKYHLPFSSIEETIFRTSGAYLLEQHLNDLKGEEFDYALDGLRARYAEIEKVNKGISKRINNITKGDAGLNAIVCLNIFAQMFDAQFESDFSIIEDAFIDEDPSF
ncbi:MAG: hypothetical protein HN576_14655 [Bacteriovoracaceae bacterium]|jgi:hypothetical protein|nr:hypothetical protein [Bacteriovoracaceae bacterium]